MLTCLRSRLVSFWNRQEGHAMVEYALVLAVIVGGIFCAVSALGLRLSGK